MPSAPLPRRSLFAVWHWPRWVWAVILALPLVAAWATSYAMLVGRQWRARPDPVTGQMRNRLEAYYPTLRALPSDVREPIQSALYPMHLIDRQLRPGVWNANYLDWLKRLEDE